MFDSTRIRAIYFMFHGEFWESGEANQFVHFRDNGLFIGQFGKCGHAMQFHCGRQDGTHGPCTA